LFGADKLSAAGTFQPYHPATGGPLVAADLNGDGFDDLVFADKQQDRVVIEYSNASTSTVLDRSDGILAPSAVDLADLNGDGLPDLIVANSGANDVLVYPGLASGRFGAPRAFSTGTDPVGLTVAYLNDEAISGGPAAPLAPAAWFDPAPDLVVTDQGSNDLTIFFGQGQGPSWTFEAGSRLDVRGRGPASTTVLYRYDPVNGRVLPNLLVADSGSNTVTLLPGVGGGSFDDRAQAVTTFATGADPQQVLVGPFTSPNSLDLVTVNRGDNSLTVLPSFQSGSSQPTTLWSGGDSPVAAVAGDFSGNGVLGLVVANNGDGQLARLDGLTITQLRSRVGLAHPSGLVWSLGSNGPTLYVATTGQDIAQPLTLQLPRPGPPTPTPTPTPTPPGSGTASIAVAGSGVPLTPQLTQTTAATTLAQGVPLIVLLLPNAGTANGEVKGIFSTAPPSSGNAEGPEAVAPGRGPVDVSASSSWLNFVLGVDEGFERSRQAARKMLFPASEHKEAAGLSAPAIDRVFAPPLQLFADTEEQEPDRTQQAPSECRPADAVPVDADAVIALLLMSLLVAPRDPQVPHRRSPRAKQLS
jgi:hypothetical protein